MSETSAPFASSINELDWALARSATAHAAAATRNVEFGAGYRVADIDSAPYGTVAFRVANGVAIKGNFGSDYIGVGVALRSW